MPTVLSVTSRKVDNGLDNGVRSRLRRTCRTKLEREQLAVRARLLRLVERARAESSDITVGDDADRATSAAEVSALLAAAERERRLLLDVERAIVKLDTGEFGLCEGTGEPIEPRRLLARPWTRFSVAYLEEREEAARRRFA